MYSYSLLPEVCHTRYHGEKRAKSFCHRENSHSLKCLFLSTSVVPKKMYLSRAQHFSRNLVDPRKSFFLTFVMFDITGENRPKFFFARNFAFFSQNFVFLTTSLVPKNWSYYFHKNRQNTLWTLTICFLTFVMFDNMGTNRPKSFLHLKICLFLPIFWVLNNLLGPKELI